MKTRASGFTLIEILIVVIILGILAAIVIPQFTEASSEARESTLVSNLQTLRSQIGLYKVQHNDEYPDTTQTSAEYEACMTSKTDIDGTINAAGDFGPYMQIVPSNPFQTNDNAPLFRFGNNPGTDAAHWCFDPATGNLWADDSGVTADNVPHIDL
ncbi:MAG: prepilin-type N-terminal cleavage/methylation domain-containing protein [Sedimentisphaerales bacterium]|nr:prepilin-type N-terminal cleavage/methylation domain-containing protein [Sedimentisphaerales bacterium]